MAEQSPLRIAAGEQETTLRGFEALLDAGLAVLQPDVARVGGLTAAMQIGRLVTQRHRLCVNHSYKTGISIAASLHFLAALPNSSLLEYCVEQSALRQTLTRLGLAEIRGTSIAMLGNKPPLGSWKTSGSTRGERPSDQLDLRANFNIDHDLAVVKKPVERFWRRVIAQPLRAEVCVF